MTHPAHHQPGFTLVEIAIVLVVVGLLVGGLITPLSTQLEQRRVADTQRAMEEAREALVGFAALNGYLPCPAVSAANGLEARDGERCAGERRAGFLPWATLGMPKLDSWGHIFMYSVTPAFADSGDRFRLATPRDITVATRDATGNLVAATAPNDIPAVIVSMGKNGYGGFSDLGVRAADAGAGNADEKANMSLAGTAYIARGASDNAALPGGAYDDLVVWVSPNVLFNRLIAAGRLP
ncbi:prepilin-type N-terminal cleavage/methylation domain-containing protein [Pseudoduganella albidiflava]|uniref:Prepilin-type N-terminal cleavage/methylation domain-containing protein n=1 Tax=Pseudoduganella albidiflava TaxID=321983 RepID=A0A411WYZ0_9BURK|nr:prepilin-type N-terminal cleavage/methylation domain-containing protein [Pseudoduganella albidiflava]QBI01927.1 prepilin-type N-terminal cleavage/methylation domain-containing protein [Pseudoduganella albidiflava]GGY38521.1 prepilin-type N-terminal cleavage/methylation domain-containing protein [Pseudoduganella albidiflava]